MPQAMPSEDAKPQEALIASVPRINIGIFCDNEQTLQAMQQAGT